MAAAANALDLLARSADLAAGVLEDSTGLYSECVAHSDWKRLGATLESQGYLYVRGVLLPSATHLSTLFSMTQQWSSTRRRRRQDSDLVATGRLAADHDDLGQVRRLGSGRLLQRASAGRWRVGETVAMRARAYGAGTQGRTAPSNSDHHTSEGHCATCAVPLPQV
jgi:hypothetical protein